MTSNLQTLTDLANSAKAHQEKFNNTLIEIHKQSVNTIERELTKIYKDEISEIKSDTKKQLSAIAYEMQEAKETILNEMRPAIMQKILNGVTLGILILGAVAGFFAGYQIFSNQITNYQAQINSLQESNDYLAKWQIPENLRYSQADKTTNQQSHYIILPKSTHNLKDGTKLFQIHNGGL